MLKFGNPHPTSLLATNLLINVFGDYIGVLAGVGVRRYLDDLGSIDEGLVVRYRGSGIPGDIEAIKSGVIQSHAQRANIPSNLLRRSIVARVIHANVRSNVSKLRPLKFRSQFVSVTSSRKIAGHFAQQGGRVFEFKVRKADLYWPWYNLHPWEFEDSALTGTRIYDVRQLPN